MREEMQPRISVTIDQVDLSLSAMLERADVAAKSGVDGLWVSQLPSQRDAGMLLAGLAARTSDVAIGTAVLPVYMCPPVVMAQTALTLDEISGNRLMLGLGRGHRIFGEWMLGGTYSSSVGPMREYLTIVTSLIRDGEVSMAGSWFDGRAFYAAPRRPRLPVYLGSFGPRMLELAAELADGVILWMCTPSYVREVVMPSLRAGWARRPGTAAGFEVVAIMPALASRQRERNRECGRNVINGYLRMENYKKLLVASGFGDDVRSLRAGDVMVDEICAIGSGQLVQERIAAYREAGVTEVALAPLTEEHFAATLEAAVAA
jgi:alkanesulfonate monooxygenase SsuD/methylene tetrahydromethanopterin reductase-like flavin-dependent oxidoreductase (luciferase family)